MPSVVEAGMPDFLAYNWVAAAVSAKTPPAVVKQLRSALFAQAGNSPGRARDYYTRQSTTLILSSPAEMRQYQKDEIERWKRLAAVAKIPPCRLARPGSLPSPSVASMRVRRAHGRAREEPGGDRAASGGEADPVMRGSRPHTATPPNPSKVPCRTQPATPAWAPPPRHRLRWKSPASLRRGLTMKRLNGARGPVDDGRPAGVAGRSARTRIGHCLPCPRRRSVRPLRGALQQWRGMRAAFRRAQGTPDLRVHPRRRSAMSASMPNSNGCCAKAPCRAPTLPRGAAPGGTPAIPCVAWTASSNLSWRQRDAMQKAPGKQNMARHGVAGQPRRSEP
ncbi:hypothetical protein ACTMU2_19235 [Cupriavidus basilensis]